MLYEPGFKYSRSERQTNRPINHQAMSSAYLKKFFNIQPAAIEWRNNQPYSTEFNDIYFSTQNGLKESHHVFIEGNQLETDWLNKPQKHFYLGELGFGSGLNFFTSASLWQKTIALSPDQQHKHLHYISIEKRPFTFDDFEQASKLWPCFSTISKNLLDYYPSLTYGRHQIQFDSLNITLTLFYMPVEEALPDLITESQRQQNKLSFDHWFLDGFAPSKNEAMWTETTCKNIAKLSKPGTRLATFSVAAAVKTPLKQAGFQIKKRHGIGLKREVLAAVYPNPADITPVNKANNKCTSNTGFINLKYKQPWFNISRSKTNNKIAIIGAGIAGCATAYSLCRQGLTVELFDTENGIANKASGAAAGIFHPQLTPDMGINSQFQWHAYLYLLRFLSGLCASEKEDIIICKGVDRLLKSASIKQQLLSLSRSLHLTQWITDKKTDIASKRGVFFPQAAALDIAKFCQLLLNKIPDNQLKLHNNCEVKSLEQYKKSWFFDINEKRHQFEQVVYCGGAQSILLPELIPYPTRISRGQTCQLTHAALQDKLKTAICEKSYLVPNKNNATLHLGTTFEDFVDNKLNLQSQLTILNNVSKLLNELNLPFHDKQHQSFLPLAGSFGYRLHAQDRLPIIGGAVNTKRLEKDFSGFGQKRITKKSISFYNQTGLWLNTAYGSHGLLYALLGSEHLACLISNGLSPISPRLASAISPVRFAMKDLKKSNHKPTPKD